MSYTELQLLLSFSPHVHIVRRNQPTQLIGNYFFKKIKLNRAKGIWKVTQNKDSGILLMFSGGRDLPMGWPIMNCWATDFEEHKEDSLE